MPLWQSDVPSGLCMFLTLLLKKIRPEHTRALFVHVSVLFSALSKYQDIAETSVKKM
jgi:hypothetical protein